MPVDPAIYKQLQTECSKKEADLTKIGELLPTLLVQGISDTPVVYQDILELAAYWAAHRRDGLAFERYFEQLQSLFYFYSKPSAPPTERQWPLVGLQLLNLLVTGRQSAFHVLLERIPDAVVEGNQFIAFPLLLEQSLIEGTFHRILQSRSQVPAAEYAWFIDGLVDTIRTELASCIEASYASVCVSEASKLLFLSANESQVLRSICQVRNWQLNGDMIVFDKVGNSDPSTIYDTGKVIEQSLTYTQYLEQII